MTATRCWRPRPGRPSTAGWVVIGSIVVGFALRLAWVLYATRDPLGYNDPGIYLGLAERLADGQGYVHPAGEPTAYYPPGFPAMLGALFWVAGKVGIDGSRPELAAAANLVLGTLTIGLAALLARRLFSARVAAVVAVLLAVFPALIGYTSVALSETLFVFGMVGSLLVLLWEPFDHDRPGWPRLGIGGVLLGATLLVRPTGALLVVALAAGLVAAGGGWRRALARSGVVMAAVALVLVPWAVRNAVRLDAGLTLSTNTGDNLCIGNNPEATGSFQLPAACFVDSPVGPDAPRDEFEVVRGRRNQDLAVDWIRQNPSRQPELVVARTLYTFQHGHDFRRAAESYGEDLWISGDDAIRLDVVGDAGWFFVLGVGLCGLPALVRGDRRWLVLAASFVGLAVAPWPFFGDPRFGLPAVVVLVFPAAVVLAALPVIWRSGTRTLTTSVVDEAAEPDAAGARC
jgi:4-amino-4-deoxy-L-arabinose transferase-like glycosyltransferase